MSKKVKVIIGIVAVLMVFSLFVGGEEEVKEPVEQDIEQQVEQEKEEDDLKIDVEERKEYINYLNNHIEDMEEALTWLDEDLGNFDFTHETEDDLRFSMNRVKNLSNKYYKNEPDVPESMKEVSSKYREAVLYLEDGVFYLEEGIEVLCPDKIDKSGEFINTGIKLMNEVKEEIN